MVIWDGNFILIAKYCSAHLRKYSWYTYLVTKDKSKEQKISRFKGKC